MQKTEKTGIVWFTNNLRIQDNEALNKAINECSRIIGVYNFNPKLFSEKVLNLKKMNITELNFYETVTNLKDNLTNLNISLLTFNKNTVDVFTELSNEHPTYSFTQNNGLKRK